MNFCIAILLTLFVTSSVAIAEVKPNLLDARAVPYYLDGSVKGVRIFAVKENGYWSQSGLKNGDIIKQIAGFEVADSEHILGAVRNKNAEPVTINIERDSSAMSLSVNRNEELDAALQGILWAGQATDRKPHVLPTMDLPQEIQADIAKSVPTEIQLTKVKLESGTDTIIFTGKSDNYSGIDKLQANLAKTKRFSKIKALVGHHGPDSIDFEVSAILTKPGA